MQATQTSLQNQQASIRKLEDQVGQIAHAMVERGKGKFLSQTKINPRNMEQLKAITLRSGRTVETNGEENGTLVEKSENANVAPIPYPQRLHKAKKDQKFSHILELFKKVNINIPLLDEVKQIPSYAKFLKDACKNKRRLLEHEKVMLSEECSDILQKKLPLKLTDPRSFTIPCTIGKSSFENALCDLADQSITYPRRIVEDVLVRVDQLILPADFLILDIEEDREIPIILGRPFLATTGTLIDVKSGLLNLRVEDKEVIVSEQFRAEHPTEHLEACVIHSYMPRVEVEEVIKIVNILNSALPHNLHWRHHYEALGPAPVKIYPSVKVAPKMLERLVGHSHYYFLDGYSVYNEIAIALKDQEKTTFTCPFGMFAYRRMLFGLCNALATFQSMGIEVDRAKTELIEKLIAPTSVKRFRSFLGHAGFYRRFIKDFSKIAKPLSNLLQKDVTFEFNLEYLSSFNTLKKLLTSAPIITAPVWSLPFELMCDASDYVVGVVLGQQKEKLPHIIYYASCTLNDA
ncbi:hypothetical protein EV2_030823 [Malus domestica]